MQHLRNAFTKASSLRRPRFSCCKMITFNNNIKTFDVFNRGIRGNVFLSSAVGGSGMLMHSRGFRISRVDNSDVIVKAPVFPESIKEGDIKWLKSVGESVTVDEVICEIETDKTSIPVPSPVNGVIVEILAQEGDAVRGGQELFKVAAKEGVAVKKPASGVPVPSPAKRSPAPAKPSPAPAKPSATPAKPSPPAPAKPSLAAPAKPSPAPAKPSPAHPLPVQSLVVKVPPADPKSNISGTRTEHRVKMNRMRQKIASRLKDAQNTAAMLTTFNEIDMSKIIAFRKTNQDAFTKKHGIKLGFMSTFVMAASHALQDQPVVNAVIEGTEIIYRDFIDISVAVATPKGLVVPVLRNVQSMNFAQIERGILELGEKAKKGELAIEDMDGGTFTISNGGVFGSLMGTPIINPPQSGILGMHATVERPVAVKGQVVVRPMMYVALTYDHRLIDGREAVLFLRKIKAVVEEPTIILAGL